MKPLAIDLYCGLGGWSEGLISEGYDVVGFDIERHQYGGHRASAMIAKIPMQLSQYIARVFKPENQSE